MNQENIDLLKMAAQHFMILKNETALLFAPNGHFFLATEFEKLKEVYGEKSLIIIDKHDVADFMGDQLYI